jgi:hypothetical protein
MHDRDQQKISETLNICVCGIYDKSHIAEIKARMANILPATTADSREEMSY